MNARGLALALVSVLAVLATLHEGGSSVWASALLRIGALIWMAILWVRYGTPRVALSIGVPLFALTLWLALAVLRVPSRAAALDVFWDWLVFACAIPFAMMLPALQSTAWIQWIRVAACAHACVALYQTLGQGLERAPSSFLNTNHLAGWLGACALLSLSVAAAEPLPRRRWFGFVVTVPMVSALLLTGSRGALLGLGVGLCALFAPRFFALLGRRRGLALGVLAAMLLVALASQWGRLTQVDPFRFYRVKIWSASLQLIGDAPIWGAGPGQFPTVAARYAFADARPPLRYDHSFSIAHSDFLRLPAEWGLPAAAIALLGVFWIAVQRRRAGGAVDRGALAVVVAVVVQGLVDDPSRWMALRWLLLLQLGVLLAPLLRQRVESRKDGTRTGWRFAASALLILALGWSFEVRGLLAHAAIPWSAVTLTSRSIEGASPEVLQSVDRAIGLYPDRADFHRLRAELLIAEDATLSRIGYRQARRELETAIRLDPQQFIYHWALARLEGRACLELFRDVKTRERAVAAYERAMRWAPKDVRIVLDGAQFARAAGDALQSRRWLEQALRSEPNAAPALLLAAELEWEQPQTQREACQKVEQAIATFRKHRDNLPAQGYSRELLSLSPAELQRWNQRCRWGASDG